MWSAESPDLHPAGYSDLRGYFNALLFPGGSSLPRDRYSGFSPSQEFDLYYEQGKTLGYGFAVAGQEVLSQPNQPLWIRYVEPGSPADLVGLRRGDRLVSLNGVSSEQVIASQDFSPLVPKTAGDTLTLSFERDGVILQQVVTAEAHSLKPVQNLRVMRTASGTKVGYVYVHAFLSQAEEGLDAAFNDFIFQGISEVVIDLRYNTGGLVSVGERLGSHIGGARTENQVYTDLLYNLGSRYKNTRYKFTNRLNWEGLSRVYVLTGMRTCSASEQLISGLRGAGLDVVQIGGTTCGKPVGFNPRSHCGNTFSVVMFESQNARGEGRYFNGISPNCAADDDWSQLLGSPNEGLLKAAIQHMQSGICPSKSGQRKPAASATGTTQWVEPITTPAMIP